MLTISRRIILLLPIRGDRENHVLTHDFEESIGYWLVIGAQAFQRALNEELAPHGVTFRQAQVLGWLALEGEMSQNELAGKMMIEPPTLVGILDRMERDGWISRIACPSDRRKKMIVVNRAAEKVWGRIVACGRRVRARAVQGLSADEIEMLKRLVRQVQANLNESAVVEKSA
jgi:MarR family transcriptional regulator for hemolysin